MPSTAAVLCRMAEFINIQGLHTGEQMAVDNPWKLDICAVAYILAEDCQTPAEFYTDESASIRIIECSAPAMQAIRAISAALDTEPCETEIAPGHAVPDYIEHVCNWAATPPVLANRPPSVPEVIGRILCAADQIDADTAPAAA